MSRQHISISKPPWPISPWGRKAHGVRRTQPGSTYGPASAQTNVIRHREDLCIPTANMSYLSIYRLCPLSAKKIAGQKILSLQRPSQTVVCWTPFVGESCRRTVGQGLTPKIWAGSCSLHTTERCKIMICQEFIFNLSEQPNQKIVYMDSLPMAKLSNMRCYYWQLKKKLAKCWVLFRQSHTDACRPWERLCGFSKSTFIKASILFLNFLRIILLIS